MSTAGNQTSKNPIGAIAGTIITMSALFGALSAIFSGLEAPIAALLLGLVITGALHVRGYWTINTAVITWLGTGIVLIIVYLIIAQPATVTGLVIRDDGTPVSGQTLILTNANGIQQRVVTDQDGRFEISDVPEGRYTIHIEAGNKLLYAGEVPSGWQRIFSPSVSTGGLPVDPVQTQHQ